GLAVGERTTALIPSDEAYGPHRDEGIIQVPRDNIPSEIMPEVGQQLQMQTHDGRPVPVVVVAVEDTAITVDANHPLAGKDLTFGFGLGAVACRPCGLWQRAGACPRPSVFTLPNRGRKPCAFGKIALFTLQPCAADQPAQEHAMTTDNRRKYSAEVVDGI